ncbi:hypothetical protein SUGI_0921890 [Cryptomeria japonica]|nr:hypothetical protein SUGI_0921890 [Cryptomeria japonica]
MDPGSGSGARAGLCSNRINGAPMYPCNGSGGKFESEIDGLLANAGYTVRASELAHVAQRLERLESVMGAVQDPGLSHLASEAVHYNPSDLAGWIESMLGELNPGLLDAGAVFRSQPPPPPAPAPGPAPVAGSGSGSGSAPFSDNSRLVGHAPLSEMDMDMALMADYGVNGGLQFNGNPHLPRAFTAEVPAAGVFSSVGEQQRRGMPNLVSAKHHRLGFQSAACEGDDEGSSVTQWGPVQQVPAVVNGDEGAQESGIRLVHLLMACAEAIQRNDLKMASSMVQEIRMMMRNPSGAMGKVASHFVEALARRIYGLNSPESSVGQADAQSELLYHHFYETCPYLKFAHFTANQAILEAVEGHDRIHVIDFNLMHGLQWPALIQALALRAGGPPFLRLTGIGPRQPDGRDVLQEIGMKLAQLAESVNVEFDFRGVMADKLDDVKPWMLQLRAGEVIAVNSIFQLHRLLYNDPSGSSPIDAVLKFTEALHYYSTMFDSLEACNLPPHSTEKLLAEMYIEKEICNIVACEGPFRVERHEPLSQWRMRLGSAGFRPAHLGSNAFKQASMLLTLFSGEGFTVEENNGSLTLGWHSRPLISASAWQGI